jgi:alpha-1,2-mannosyltransferase
MSWREHWPLIALIALLAAVGVVSFTQAIKLDYDFHHFYRDAAYVWEHGQLNPDLDNPERSQRRQLTFYLPAVALLLSPLTAGGVAPAAAVWTVAQLVALAYCLKVLAGWGNAAGKRTPPLAAVLIATAVALPAIYETARFNQLSFFVLALVLAGVTALQRGKSRRAGIWLGLATVLKLLPGIFLVWLILKRRWVAAGSLVLTVLIVALLPCLVVFGPRATLEHHRHPDPFQPLSLSERVCRLVSQVFGLALAIGLVWMTRRPLVFRPLPGEFAEPFADRIRIEVAVYLIAMLVLSPLLRTYYLVWALPGLVLLTRFGLDARERRLQRLGQIGVAIWVLGMLAWMSDTARDYGVHLVMLTALAIALLRLGSQTKGRSETPAD